MDATSGFEWQVSEKFESRSCKNYSVDKFYDESSKSRHSLCEYCSDESKFKERLLQQSIGNISSQDLGVKSDLIRDHLEVDDFASFSNASRKSHENPQEEPDE